MKVTYIKHSGFMTETANFVCLFDYYSGELPEFDNNKNVYVFVSHAHGDHFNPDIFKMFADIPSARFILSSDIRNKSHSIRNSGITERQIQQISYISADSTIGFTEHDGNFMEIKALKSTDAGVAFLTHFDGQTVYHAGDLNWWVWDGDSKAEAMDMNARFIRAVENLRGIEIDCAFLPLDPRQEELFYKGFDYYMKTAVIKKAFPMHFWGDTSVIRRLKEKDCAKDYCEAVIDIEREGQIYEI